jgi:hypothetical protein
MPSSFSLYTPIPLRNKRNDKRGMIAKISGPAAQLYLSGFRIEAKSSFH